MACSFASCKSSKSKKEPGVSFHSIPADAVKREQWIKAIGRKDWVPHKSALVCSKHFAESDFDRSSTVRVYLIDDAVPRFVEEPLCTQPFIESYVVGPDEDEDGVTMIHEVTPTMPESSTSTTLRQLLSNSASTTQQHRNSPDLQDLGNHKKEGLKKQNNVSCKRTNKDEDECDLFAKILAKKLRKLPEHDRFLFMYEIDGMFISRLCGETSSLTPNHTSSVEYSNGPSASQTPRSDSSDS